MPGPFPPQLCTPRPGPWAQAGDIAGLKRFPKACCCVENLGPWEELLGRGTSEAALPVTKTSVGPGSFACWVSFT